MLRAILAQDVLVDLICLNQSEAATSSKDIADRLRSRYPKLRTVTVRRHPMFIRKWEPRNVASRLRYLSARATDALSGRTDAINSRKHCPPNLDRLVQEKTHKNYEYIWFNYLRVIPKRLRTRSKIIADLHDYQTERIRADVIPQLPNWRRARYLRKFSRSEREVLSTCDVAIAISPVEQSLLTKELTPKGKLVCVPATDDAHPIGQRNVQHDLLFVGSRSDANLAGIVWFLEQCFPAIVAAKPLVRLLIQGTIVRTNYLKRGTSELPHGANITLSGPVESLADVYAAAEVVICPVLHGTGMKIKMVEAMAYGQAIVATSKAAEGIETDLGLETYDTPDEFSAACIELLSDPVALSRSRSVAKATFDRDHSNERLAGRVREVLTAADQSD